MHFFVSVRVCVCVCVCVPWPNFKTKKQSQVIFGYAAFLYVHMILHRYKFFLLYISLSVYKCLTRSMFILKKPIIKQWFLASKPGLLVFIFLESDVEENIDSILKCFKFHYNSTKFLFQFTHKISNCLKNKIFTDFEDKLDSETFGGVKGGKIYLRNSFNFTFVFEEEDSIIFFINGIIEVLPSIILPNQSETQWFLKNTFEESSLFFKAHENFINQWKYMSVLQNSNNNDQE